MRGYANRALGRRCEAAPPHRSLQACRGGDEAFSTARGHAVRPLGGRSPDDKVGSREGRDGKAPCTAQIDVPRESVSDYHYSLPLRQPPPRCRTGPATGGVPVCRLVPAGAVFARIVRRGGAEGKGIKGALGDGDFLVGTLDESSTEGQTLFFPQPIPATVPATHCPCWLERPVPCSPTCPRQRPPRGSAPAPLRPSPIGGRGSAPRPTDELRRLRPANGSTEPGSGT